MKIIILLFCGLFLFESCGYDKCNTEVKLLTGCKFKYWDAYNKDAKVPYGAYRIDLDGSCYYFKYNYDTKPPNISFFYQDDIAGLPNRWKLLKNDSLSLVVDIWLYEILKKNEDTLDLINCNNNTQITLVTSQIKKDRFNIDSLKKCKGTPYFYNKK